ncbi:MULTISPECIES: hypothetical protein [unclassified Methylophilus]|uniref:hypothetical protein n=1 Tax=unclassified Methylophilus TaxID=2630143 RepID=UPI000368FB25|nr:MULTISPECIES: hypothetical protein [unclassified Methylophilus]
MLDALLQSEWLIRMLDKSGKHAAHKLFALFNILDDLLSSPMAQLPANTTTDINPPDRLQYYLTAQAQLAGARLPDMLANQLYFMARSACQEKLLHPQSSALQHARQAAQALLDVQTRREINWLAIRNYGVVIVTLLFGVIGGYYWHMQITPVPALQAKAPEYSPPAHPLSHEASPSETAAIYSRLETMKHGDCRLLEAIQLPERLKSIYIENIINGHVTTNRDEQVLVNQLLDQVKCNYTPKLMLNSK